MNVVCSPESIRRLSSSLAGYLCGTHSGLLASRRRDRLDLRELARQHRALPDADAGEGMIHIGVRPWQPPEPARALAARLRSALNDQAVADLIVFGSQARGGTTGFSDVDAILVIHDAIAEDPITLESIRPRVLAAQRAVIAHQPMQHHGFEVATPKLLCRANDALRMPAVALSETRSLTGNSTAAAFEPDRPDVTKARFLELVGSVSGVRTWPRHPWRLHALVSMFELIPALYLQALGHPLPKWRSFAEARGHFGDAWWPYDVLDEVRDSWPSRSALGLRAAAVALRNPWVATTAWSRLPAGSVKPAYTLLSSECLDALQSLAREMSDRAC